MQKPLGTQELREFWEPSGSQGWGGGEVTMDKGWANADDTFQLGLSRLKEASLFQAPD